MRAPVTIKEKPDAMEKPTFDDCIKFQHVNFKYLDDWVLQDINLHIMKGKSIAVVGESGSGKSTLVDLIPRLIDYDEGEILLDGKSLKDYKIKDIRNLMGVVTQDSILFNDTVHHNIAFGMDNITREDVIEAAKAANAHEFIEQMPDGYETNIGDMGNKMSGGQQQRLTIARALLKNPPILIFDEATSSLDTKSEKQVQDAIKQLSKNRTSVIIAHRLSTIQEADEIIVLHQGKIVEKGNHQNLLKLNGYYKQLVDLQKFD
jgi:subfamily B ATP-binding cassette protein MsbA